MKYKVQVYGPFGPNQMSETITKSFDTHQERQDYIEKPKQLETVLKTWEV